MLRYHDESGNTFDIERFEGLLPIVEFELMPGKTGCAPCPHRGKNLSCPPFSPAFAEYAKATNVARVISYRVSIANFKAGTVLERAYAAFGQMKARLVADLLKEREAGHIIAGSGHCDVCKQCAAELDNDACRFPDKMIYSLESLGVHVARLSEKAFDIKVEWSDEEHAANYVSAIGAVFLRE